MSVQFIKLMLKVEGRPLEYHTIHVNEQLKRTLTAAAWTDIEYLDSDKKFIDSNSKNSSLSCRTRKQYKCYNQLNSVSVQNHVNSNLTHWRRFKKTHKYT